MVFEPKPTQSNKQSTNCVHKYLLFQTNSVENLLFNDSKKNQIT